MLTGVYVVLVPVIHCFLHKKFHFKPLLNGALMLVGMFFLFDVGESGNFNRGDAITLIGACFFAAQIILVDKYSERVNIFNFTAIQMLAMGVLGIVGAVAMERQTFSSVDWAACLPAVLYLGVLSSAFAYMMQTWVQSRVSPSLAAVLLGLESLASVLFSLAFGRVGWSLHLALGCAIMAAASISAAIGDNKELLNALPTEGAGDEEDGESRKT
jgi:drug/metabolite transporter (DMT)-like permease